MYTKEKRLLGNLFLPLAVGAISALLSMNGMREFGNLNQPPLSPPSWLFPVVWTILYLMMGYATYLVWNSDSRETENYMIRETGLNLFAIQLIVNFFWSIIFFRFDMYLFAFFWLFLLWVLIIVNIVVYAKIRPLAAYLLIPYLLWVTFAGYLNFGVYALNP